jgi:hypothetical protein
LVASRERAPDLYDLNQVKVSTAMVSTESAQSYMRKLGQHWSHHFVVLLDEYNGCTIKMPNATCELQPNPNHLDVRLTVQGGADQDRMEHVIEDHIKRLGFREELQFVWDRVET